jgi:serine/threonine protein kinase
VSSGGQSFLACPLCGSNVPRGDERCLSCGATIETLSGIDKEQGSLRPGDRLGDRYEIEGVLGSGGFGVTYKATHLSTNAKVAVKELIPPSSTSASSASTSNGARDVKTRFLQEAEILRSITHPSVVRVYESFELNNHAYIALEFLSGETLESLIEQNGHWSEQQALKLADTICDALRSVHDAGLLHRDLKPANVMMVPGRGPVLIDFGSARKSNVDKTRALSQIVTPGFAAPEQYGSKGRVGPFTDIYGLSSMLYTVLTNDLAPAAMERMAFDDFEPLQRRLPETKTCLPHAIDRGLSLEVAKRHASVDEFLVEAKSLRGGSTPAPPPKQEPPKYEPSAGPEPQSQTWPEIKRKKRSRRSLLRALVIALIISGIGGIAVGGIVKLLGKGDQVSTQTGTKVGDLAAAEPSGADEVETTEPDPTTTTLAEVAEPVSTRTVIKVEPIESPTTESATTESPTTEAAQFVDLKLTPRRYTNFDADKFGAEIIDGGTAKGTETVTRDQVIDAEAEYSRVHPFTSEGLIDSGTERRAQLYGDTFWPPKGWDITITNFVPFESGGTQAGLLVPVVITNATTKEMCNVRYTFTVANTETTNKLAVLKDYTIYFPQSEVRIAPNSMFFSVVEVPRSAMKSYPTTTFGWSIVKTDGKTEFCD